ncbi:MAG: HNH endonuclease [Dokdonella sp.]|uniref:HNH endonuclease n=1 Tax=Dokdonella sp. TaxID=2291710 RepID=UPI0032630751
MGKWKKSVIPLNRLSDAKLNLARAEAWRRVVPLRDKSEAYAAGSSQREANAREYDLLTRELAAIEATIHELLSDRRPRMGALGKFLGLTRVPPGALSQIEVLKNRRSELEARQKNLHGGPPDPARAFATAMERLLRFDREIDRRKRKSEALESLRAAAAFAAADTRKVASSIKRKLERQPLCPYCGYKLNELLHAEHIYPVAKGGRSTRANMVNVCESCNARKGKMTLTAFIKKYELNREAIEARLTALGKEF